MLCYVSVLYTLYIYVYIFLYYHFGEIKLFVLNNVHRIVSLNSS